MNQHAKVKIAILRSLKRMPKTYTMRDEDLREHFARFGEVASAKVMTDRETGRSKGFAFVEMASGEDARSAISGMHGQSFGGRALVVNAARPREDRPAGGFGGGGYGGNRRSSY